MDKKPCMTHYQAARKKRIRVSTIMIFMVIPALMAIGYLLLKDRWYLPLSILILIAIMSPFFMMFENRKPKAREIVLIAMMSALTVTAQMIFHVIMPFQVGTALVVISGISLGPEAGFLIGALARFVVNFYMGQGAWTPWQMFCWGLLGFLAGICFNSDSINELKARKFTVIIGPIMMIIAAEALGYIFFLLFPGKDESFIGWRLYAFGAVGLLIGVLLQAKRLPIDSVTLALFTFCTTFVIYGGIMNVAAMLLSMNTPGAPSLSLNTLRLLYISGAPYDFLHAITASICIFLFGGIIIKKLERIKIKYGIYR